jgi:hypothetical protein
MKPTLKNYIKVCLVIVAGLFILAKITPTTSQADRPSYATNCVEPKEINGVMTFVSVPCKGAEESYAQVQARAQASNDDKAEPMVVLLWYHNNCANLLYPPEISRYNRVISNASPSAVRAGQRTINNGTAIWGGEEGYCGMLTAWIKQELPELRNRLKS